MQQQLPGGDGWTRGALLCTVANARMLLVLGQDKVADAALPNAAMATGLSAPASLTSSNGFAKNTARPGEVPSSVPSIPAAGDLFVPQLSQRGALGGGGCHISHP